MDPFDSRFDVAEDWVPWRRRPGVRRLALLVVVALVAALVIPAVIRSLRDRDRIPRPRPDGVVTAPPAPGNTSSTAVVLVTMNEFSIRMANRPGQLATLTRELAVAGVNIETLAAMTEGPEGYIKIVVNDEEKTRRVLEEAGVDFEERRVISATLRDRPGALAEFAEALANTGVNIEAMYLLQSSGDGLHFAIAVDDPESAKKVTANT